MKKFNEAVQANQPTLSQVTNLSKPGVAYSWFPAQPQIAVQPLPSLENFNLQWQRLQTAEDAFHKAKVEFDAFNHQFQAEMVKHIKVQLEAIKELAIAFRLENDPDYAAVFLYDKYQLLVQGNLLHISFYSKEGERLGLMELSPLILEGKLDAYKLQVSGQMLAKIQAKLDQAYKERHDFPSWQPPPSWRDLRKQ